MKNWLFLLAIVILVEGCALTVEQASQESRCISRQSRQMIQQNLQLTLTTLEVIEDSIDYRFKERQLKMLRDLRESYPKDHRKITATFEKVATIHREIRQLVVSLKKFMTNSMHSIEEAESNVDTTIQKLLAEIRTNGIQNQAE